jgi:predicted protein tyrosine phosphatase
VQPHGRSIAWKSSRGDVTRTARSPVTPELLTWADLIFVMEKSHRNKPLKQFRANIKNQKIVELGITDDYEYMDERLVRLFEALVPQHLGIPLKQGRISRGLSGIRWTHDCSGYNKWCGILFRR